MGMAQPAPMVSEFRVRAMRARAAAFSLWISASVRARPSVIERPRGERVPLRFAAVVPCSLSNSLCALCVPWVKKQR